MNLNCHNNLDIYGPWEELKTFFSNNSTEKSVLSFENYVSNEDGWGTELDAEVTDWDQDLMEEKMEQFYYVFMTKETPPNLWLDKIAKIYNKLEFNLIYQNRELGLTGEIIYKNGILYHNFKTEEEPYQEIQVSL